MAVVILLSCYCCCCISISHYPYPISIFSLLTATWWVGVAEGVATLEYRNTRSGYLLTYVPKYIYQVSWWLQMFHSTPSTPPPPPSPEAPRKMAWQWWWKYTIWQCIKTECIHLYIWPQLRSFVFWSVNLHVPPIWDAGKWPESRWKTPENTVIFVICVLASLSEDVSVFCLSVRVFVCPSVC